MTVTKSALINGQRSDSDDKYLSPLAVNVLCVNETDY